MDYIEINTKTTEDLFQALLGQGTLIPIIGAGFTRGQRAKRGHVLGGDELIVRMRMEIEKNNPNINIDDLASMDFKQTAELFMKDKFVPRPARRQVLEDHFTGVRLDERRTSFLAINWRYVYTLNVDDAIEKNSRYQQQVLPYRNISNAAKSLDPVFKIHGDAGYELAHEEPNSLIFATDSYLQSFTTNSSMLVTLRGDLVDSNTLFVGCSLRDEIDLLYTLSGFSGTYPPGRKSIFVTTNKPNVLDEDRLERHGINTVVLAPTHEKFIDWICALSVEVNPLPSAIAKHKVSRVVFPYKKKPGENLKSVVRDPSDRPAIRATELPLPDYYIDRDIFRAIFSAIERENVALIQGRRFSGRTTLLKGLAKELKSKNVYLFSSQSSVSHDHLREILVARNSVFLFDSHSLDGADANYLVRRLDQIRGNDSAIVAVADRTEPDVVGALNVATTEASEFDLDSKFSSVEMKSMNRKLDQLGLIKWNERLNLLNNAFRVLNQHPELRGGLIASANLSPAEQDVVLVLAVLDKCPSSMASALGVRGAALMELATKLAPVVDLVDTDFAEYRATQSKRKLIHQSSIGIRLSLHRILLSEQDRSFADRLFAVCSTLFAISQFNRASKSLVMFDVINDLLVDQRGGHILPGFNGVVLDLYERLQAIFSDVPDYWLQRAKAILRVEKNPTGLLEGIGFAKKALTDGRARTADNAEFTIALLYGELCRAKAFRESMDLLEAIDWFYRAISNYSNNEKYVKSLIGTGTSFTALCNHLEHGQTGNILLLTKKHEVDFILSARKRMLHEAGRSTR